MFMYVHRFKNKAGKMEVINARACPNEDEARSFAAADFREAALSYAHKPNAGEEDFIVTHADFEPADDGFPGAYKPDYANTILKLEIKVS